MIITPPFTEMQKKVIEATEKLADKKKLCDIDGVDDIVITNFDRITASPEALAKFLAMWFVLPCKLCEHFCCEKCTAKISERHCDDAEAFKKWLNEESKE